MGNDTDKEDLILEGIKDLKDQVKSLRDDIDIKISRIFQNLENEKILNAEQNLKIDQINKDLSGYGSRLNRHVSNYNEKVQIVTRAVDKLIIKNNILQVGLSFTIVSVVGYLIKYVLDKLF